MLEDRIITTAPVKYDRELPLMQVRRAGPPELEMKEHPRINASEDQNCKADPVWFINVTFSRKIDFTEET